MQFDNGLTVPKGWAHISGHREMCREEEAAGGGGGRVESASANSVPNPYVVTAITECTRIINHASSSLSLPLSLALSLYFSPFLSLLPLSLSFSISLPLSVSLPLSLFSLSLSVYLSISLYLSLPLTAWGIAVYEVHVNHVSCSEHTARFARAADWFRSAKTRPPDRVLSGAPRTSPKHISIHGISYRVYAL